jgi:apolipoprotein N-acyltransferase
MDQSMLPDKEMLMAIASSFSPTSRTFARIAIGVAVSLMTSLALILAFHPYSAWPLAFMALVPMLVAQHRILPLKWSGLAQAVGIGGWLFVFLSAMFGGNPAAQVIRIVVLVIIIIQILTAPGVRRFHEQTRYRWFVWQGVADWVGLEMVRSFVPPINTHAFIAQTMYTQPWMLQPISVFGIYGLGIVLLLSNFTLAQGALCLFDAKWQLEDQPVSYTHLTLPTIYSV